jgi:uncharacterized protein YciI
MFVANPTEVPSGIFAYTLRPTRLAMLSDGPTHAELAIAAEHWTYSQQLLVQDIMIFAGRTLSVTEDSFAICVIRSRSEAEARAIMDGDPAIQAGMFIGRLFPYQPMLIADWPLPA